MKYTAEQLGAMPENELNGVLRRLVYGDDKDVIRLNIDFCNDAGATMALALDQALSINVACQFDYHLGDGKWVVSEYVAACHGMTIDVGGKYFNDDNPLRAAVCCLILVLQERNA